MMVKLRSSPLCFLLCIASWICLFLNVQNADGFDPLIRLPSSGFSRNSSSVSGVELYLNAFGAKGDGITDDTKIFQAVWEIACTSPSHAKIVIPAGKKYLVRPIDFPGPCQSNVTLRISGSIVAPKNPDVWDGLNKHKWLYFHGVKNLTIEGGGTIDGMGQEWWERSCKINETNPCRPAPTAVTFHRCKNLKVRNILILNSQKMHIAFTTCRSVAVSHLEVFAPADSPNTDGIHISASTRVEIKESTVSTGDDCVSIVGNSSRIHIRKIACGPGHGISIGSLGKSNSMAQIHDIIINGAYISNTENGVRIKTWQGGSGFAKKIVFQNVWMENVSNPIIIDQYYCDSRLPCSNQTSAVNISNISFINIKGTSDTEEAIRFACSDTSPCTKLYLEDIQLVSSSGDITTSFCWEAYGSISGTVLPSLCFPCGKGVIKQPVLSSLIQSM